MAGLSSIASEIAVGVLLVGLLIGAIADWRSREVTDHLWLGMALGGGVLGGVALAGASSPALISWGLVTLLALLELSPWDPPVERIRAWLPELVEVLAFVGSGLGLLGIALVDGVEGSGVPTIAIAAYVGVLLARGLFELRVLYGGADAKALIAISLLVPLDASSWIGLPSRATSILALYPFSLTVLMNAALLSIAVPIALAIRNLRRREFRGWSGFSTYSLPVGRLPEAFVWLKEPALPGMEAEADAVETTAEDRALRGRQREALEARGVERIRVAPQLPFLVAIFLGTVSALALGNLLIDLVALL